MCIDHLAGAFGRAGFQPVIIDPEEGDSFADALDGAALQPTELVFTFNILGEAIHYGRSIGEHFRASHVIQYVDYPLSHGSLLDRTAAGSALLFIDETHPTAVASVYGKQRFASLGFSPHGALGDTVTPGPDPDAFNRSRPISVLFSGTFFEPCERPWREFPQPVRQIYDAAYDLAFSRDGVPALGAVDAAMADFGWAPSDPKLAPIRKGAFMIHERVRGERRLQLLRMTALMRIPIHVCGQGYDAWLDEFPNATYLGAFGVEESIALMGQARVVLNVNANFIAGSHERVFSAMKAGAAVVSDASSFYLSNFATGREIAVFRWGHLEEDLQIVTRLANDAEAALALARAGQEKVVNEHLWDHRVPAILAAAENARG